MRIVFHGENASTFLAGFAEMLDGRHEIMAVPDALASESDRRAFASAEVLIGILLRHGLPALERLRLYHLPATGHDGIDRSLLPAGAALCNCHGHERPIAEFVMAGLLLGAHPLTDADRRLRLGDWHYWAGRPQMLREELGERTLGLVGFGHIGREVAARARGFGMRIHAANRSPIAPGPLVDRVFGLDEIEALMASSDDIVVSLPLAPETRGLIGAKALAAMRPGGSITNVGRGPVIDEAALYEALRSRAIARAVIDTWYVYPGAGNASPHPSRFPFHELDNVVMTPHMSGWSTGTVRRRQETMARNIARLARGEPLENLLQ